MFLKIKNLNKLKSQKIISPRTGIKISPPYNGSGQTNGDEKKSIGNEKKKEKESMNKNPTKSSNQIKNTFFPLRRPNDKKLFITPEVEKKQIEKDALNKLFRECVKEWCENTTSHGFANMVRTDSWVIRMLWIVLVIIFMGYCIYTVVEIILTFFEFQVVVNYQILTQSPAIFPAVTICNLNPFDVATENTTGNYINNALAINSITSNITINGTEKGITLVEEAASVLKAYATADKSITDIDRKKLGFYIDTMIVSCFYNNAECNTSSDFFWFRDSEFGNCFTFNDLLNGYNQIQDAKISSKSGPDNGLKMEVFVGVGGSQDYYTMKKGIKVVVHDRGVRPLLKYDGIEVATGIAANVAISKTNISKLEAPYSDCRKEPDNLNEKDSKYHRYTHQISKYYKKLCYEICLQYEQIVPNCGCADASIPIINSNQTICSNKTDLDCVKSKRDDFDSNQNIDEVCGKHCPTECNTLVYSTSVSSSSYPTDYYGKILITQSNLIDKFNPLNTFQPLNTNKGKKLRKKRAAPSGVGGGAGAGGQNQNLASSTTTVISSILTNSYISPTTVMSSLSFINFISPTSSIAAGSTTKKANIGGGGGGAGGNGGGAGAGGGGGGAGGQNQNLASSSSTLGSTISINNFIATSSISSLAGAGAPGNGNSAGGGGAGGNGGGAVAGGSGGTGGAATGGNGGGGAATGGNGGGGAATGGNGGSPTNNLVTTKTAPNTIQVQSSVLMVSIYYEDLKYTYITESPAMTFETMMGLIGGQFGLYMGASFLSFIEILEMFINLGRLSFKYSKAKKDLKSKINI